MHTALVQGLPRYVHNLDELCNFFTEMGRPGTGTTSYMYMYMHGWYSKQANSEMVLATVGEHKTAI